MNQTTLHPGLTKLLDVSRVKSQYPEVVCFSAYNKIEYDILGSGLEQLVKFRLLHPETPVCFFSFLPMAKLLPKDEFGVLQLAGTEFIQLPCSKESIIQTAENHNGKPLAVTDSAWKSFSESACKALLKKFVRMITHEFGQKEHQISNRVLNIMRSNCLGMLSMPQLKEEYLTLLQKNFEGLHNYISNPKIAELLKWCVVCSDSSDAYLKNAFSFSRQLKQLARYSPQTNATEIISLIDCINESFKKLQPE